MKNLFRATCAAALLACAFVSPIIAGEAECFPREVAVRILIEKYGETPQSMGLIQDVAVLEFWANVMTETWTITTTTADGRTCVITSGNGYVRA